MCSWERRGSCPLPGKEGGCGQAPAGPPRGQQRARAPRAPRPAPGSWVLPSHTSSGSHAERPERTGARQAPALALGTPTGLHPCGSWGGHGWGPQEWLASGCSMDGSCPHRLRACGALRQVGADRTPPPPITWKWVGHKELRQGDTGPSTPCSLARERRAPLPSGQMARNATTSPRSSASQDVLQAGGGAVGGGGHLGSQTPHRPQGRGPGMDGPVATGLQEGEHGPGRTRAQLTCGLTVTNFSTKAATAWDQWVL